MQSASDRITQISYPNATYPGVHETCDILTVGQYLQPTRNHLPARGVRVEVDESDDRMQKKIRNAQKAKVPYMLIAGDDDMAAGSVSFRYRDGSQNNGVAVEEAVAEIVAAVRERT
jgi:threonyl-tRNA synthetase